LIHKVPAIVDAQQFARVSAVIGDADQSVPNFLYCGTWLKDAYFVIRAFAFQEKMGFDAG